MMLSDDSNFDAKPTSGVCLHTALVARWQNCAKLGQESRSDGSGQVCQDL
eukprot:CAMPEP_0195018868 /NCGR_PEP_ID=MMETSP0326_2-20130528/31398_1 /TAXON_ID=2866 ORGANISM="Crypthecodinium cohnii, Strain Seligo" /NCGR_SAMPLE_ID=MMETSP0326_2 /ASSEMBLY_ACC=CAM_ASM_000348 /LENGTH=49 /DNA_ID= /DNA_START= /DNA_END= /DNA_ORIENTATION=